MADRELGIYQLGFNNVRVTTRDDDRGGHFVSVPKGELPLMVIGIASKQENWARVVSVLMHEATEYVCANQLQLRFSQDADFASNSADFWFWMNHQQFAEALARVAYFMVDVIPDLSKRFNDQFAEITETYQI